MTYDVSIQEAFLGASNNILIMIYGFIPRLLAALVVFLIGIILGNWTKQVTVHLLNSINLSSFIHKTSFQQFLERAEFKSKLEVIVGTLLKWLLILIFSVTAINLLGLPTISTVLNNILAYIPKVVSAIFVLAIGVFLAGVVERLIKGAVAQFDIKVGRFMGKVASYLMVIFAALAAFNELGIAKEFINTLFMGFIAMLALGFGLAIGLGAKDLVAEILKEWYKRVREEIKKDKQ